MPNRKWNRMILDQLKDQLRTRSEAAELADVLRLSQDSIYRRLRGETPFTLRDLILLGQRYRISVDHVIHHRADRPSIPASLQCLQQHQFEGLLTDETQVNVMLRDLPSELFKGLRRLDQFYAPYTTGPTDLGLLHQPAYHGQIEYYFSDHLFEIFVHRLHRFRIRNRIPDSVWTSSFIPELRTLFERIERVINLFHPTGDQRPVAHYSPEPVPSNLMLLRLRRTRIGCIFHESGMIITDTAGPLYRWIDLQFELRRLTSTPCDGGHSLATRQLLSRWLGECLQT